VTTADGNISEVPYDNAAGEEINWKKTQFVVILLEY